MNHLNSVIELAQNLTDEQIRDLVLSANIAELQPSNINLPFSCQVIESMILPINVPIYKLNVVVKPEHTSTFVVDAADGFPRYYLDKSIAEEEMIDWVSARARSHPCSVLKNGLFL